MYAKGISQRDMEEHLRDLYGIDASHTILSNIIDRITLSGHKDFLGIWKSTGAESFKYWLTVLNALKNRGLEDILIICSDNLKGFTEAIKATFPNTEIQKSVVHQIRNSTKDFHIKIENIFVQI